MNAQVQQIAARMRELRDTVDYTMAQMAEACGVDEATYAAYEQGGIDIPIGFLIEMAGQFGMDVTVLLTGEEPKLHTYCLTRAGKGIKVERNPHYSYQSLAFNFINKQSEPLYVVVDPEPAGAPIPVNSHPGQEFDYILQGTMRISIGGKEMVLNPGDSIFFDSACPHGMLAVGDEPVHFLAIVYS